MLTPEQLLDLCGRLGLGPDARQIIQNIRTSPPSRNVQGGRGNVCARYPSGKMGHTVQAESHTLELPGIYQYEHDDNTLEFYDQPPKITLKWVAASGRRTGIWHTPDFFVIRRDGIGWEEWKKEEELKELSVKQPNRYVRNTDGSWHCPPGEEFSAKFGLSYRICSSKEINWVSHDNLVFLEDYLLEDCPDVEPAKTEVVYRLFDGKTHLLLCDLLEHPEPPIDADVIYGMIARRQLLCDLQDERLCNPERVRVFRDTAAAEAYRLFRSKQSVRQMLNAEIAFQTGTQLTWDSRAWQVVNTGSHEIAIKSDDNKLITLSLVEFERLLIDGQIQPVKADAVQANPAEALLLGARKEDLKEANRRQGIIEPFLSGAPVTRGEVCERTIFNYLADYRAAELTYGNGYVGLLPKHKKKGRRDARLPEAVLALMQEVITTRYENLRSPRPWAVYGKFVSIAEERLIPKVSFKTFLKYIRARPQVEQTRKREGSSAAYQVSGFYWVLEQTTPRHGSRPFEIGHIDHTELEIELISSKSGLNLGRPWLTLFIDAYTRTVLAFHISFEKPSYRACMMVIRECVRHHGRLPQFIVSDRGAEFQSTYYQSLLAVLKRTQKYRPPKQPRFGSVIERLFGVSQSQLVHNLRGNTKLMRDVRKVTKAVNPKTLAVWTLPDFLILFEGWLRTCYELQPHPALGMSPRDAMTHGMRMAGQRKFKLIPYDSMFELITCPTTVKGRAKVDSARGVKVNYLNYWNDAFRRSGVVNTRVAVRYDPYNAGIVYAYVGGQWITCISEHYHVFNGRTVMEVQKASQELMQARRIVEKGRVSSAARIADYLMAAEKHESKSVERLQEAERKLVQNAHEAVPLALVVNNGTREKTRKTRRHKAARLPHYED